MDVTHLPTPIVHVNDPSDNTTPLVRSADGAAFSDDSFALSNEPSPLQSHGVRPTLGETASAYAASSLRWVGARLLSFHVVKRAVRAVAPELIPLSSAEERKRAAMNEMLRNRHREFLMPGEVKIHVCTWNVALSAPPDEIDRWLCVADPQTGMEDGEVPDVVAVCLQEAELSGTALMFECTEASVLWVEAVQTALNRRAAKLAAGGPAARFRKVEVVQLVGLVLILFVQKDHVPNVRNVRKAITRTGALALMGNKGAIGIRATIYGKRFLFICAHFAPHDRNVSRRHANYRNSLAELQLDVGNCLVDDEVDHCIESQRESQVQQQRRGTGFKLIERIFQSPLRGNSAALRGQRLIGTHDYVFFAGDLNYRIADLDHAEVTSAAKRADYDLLLDHDQLRKGIMEGRIFRNFEEAEVSFPPTYKYDPGTDTFDTSKKRRTPAYTDRVLFRCLAPDEKVVAPFAPVRSKLSKVLDRVSRPLRKQDSLHHLAVRARRESYHNFAPQVTARRRLAKSQGSFGSLEEVEEGGGTSPSKDDDNSPPPPVEDTTLFAQAKAATAAHAEHDAAGQDAYSASGSSTASAGALESMRGMPYIVNHLVVDRYCSFNEIRASDHKPVAAAFRAVVVHMDPDRTKRVVFEVMQELEVDDTAAGDLDFE